MGYYISQSETCFTIKSNKIPALLEKIKSIHNAHACENIQDAFKCWRWEVTIDESTGDIVDIYFNGEKLGDDKILFKAIAPFVEADSCIQMLEEDSPMWHWYFDGNTCLAQEEVIILSD